MKIAIIVCLAAMVAAEKLPAAAPPPPVAILLQQQVNPDAFGAHSSNFESEDGIKVQMSGNEGATGGSNMAGSFSYLLDNGELQTVNYVANENGFQPDPSVLPVAPLALHPVPQHALDQIEKARLEDEAKAREAIAAARK